MNERIPIITLTDNQSHIPLTEDEQQFALEAAIWVTCSTTVRGTQNQVVAANLIHLNHGEKQWADVAESIGLRA